MKTSLSLCTLLCCGLSSFASAQPYQRAQQKLQVQQRGPVVQQHRIENIKNIHEAMAVYEVRHKNIKPVKITVKENKKAVQLCLLLDTSNSMDGLINQAKSQLWMIVNDLAKTQKNNQDIDFEVALYEYGNSGLSVTDGFIRQVSPFTSDLDAISEKLFSLKTNGGDEYCGHVIASAINQLQWNPSKEALKMIYIAGNEPFKQGNVNYQVSSQISKKRGIIVNTIHCGNNKQGVDGLWQHGAKLGGGSYFSINSDLLTAGIATPYDDQLIKCNTQINGTYLRYGQKGKASLESQTLNDARSLQFSKSNLASRVQSKGSNLYQNDHWDLVDASKDQNFDLKNVDKQTLPDELKDKTTEQIKAMIVKKKSERQVIQKQIAELSKKRDAYIQKKRAEMKKDNTLGSAILKSLREQARSRNFDYKNT